jgi:hypothetical protein
MHFKIGFHQFYVSRSCYILVSSLNKSRNYEAMYLNIQFLRDFKLWIPHICNVIT